MGGSSGRIVLKSGGAEQAAAGRERIRLNFYREMDDVAEAVRNAQRRDKQCVVLIGAGCSTTGGVPAANGFVDIIRKDWTAAYRRAAKKAEPAKPTYPLCMAELSEAERRDLIA